MATNYRWYVEPLDEHTNGIIARELTVTECAEEKLCADNVRRNLWECGRKWLTYLKRSSTTAQLRFKVFVQEGFNGRIREWKFE